MVLHFGVGVPLFRGRLKSPVVAVLEVKINPTKPSETSHEVAKLDCHLGVFRMVQNVDHLKSKFQILTRNRNI